MSSWSNGKDGGWKVDQESESGWDQHNEDAANHSNWTGKKKAGQQSFSTYAKWLDDTTFKVEYEGAKLTDEGMTEWVAAMDAEIESYFQGNCPALTMAMLNFSNNRLTDKGVITVLDFLCERGVSVDKVMLHKNTIRDEGARAIGHLLVNSSRPVQEVHLSHNEISEAGISFIVEAMRGSERYPYDSNRSGKSKSKKLVPLWMRVENNTINVKSMEKLLDKSIPWCTASSNNRWAQEGNHQSTPMLCLHKTYSGQKPARAQDHSSAERPVWKKGANVLSTNECTRPNAASSWDTSDEGWETVGANLEAAAKVGSGKGVSKKGGGGTETQLQPSKGAPPPPRMPPPPQRKIIGTPVGGSALAEYNYTKPMADQKQLFSPKAGAVTVLQKDQNVPGGKGRSKLAAPVGVGEDTQRGSESTTAFSSENVTTSADVSGPVGAPPGSAKRFNWDIPPPPPDPKQVGAHSVAHDEIHRTNVPDEQENIGVDQCADEADLLKRLLNIHVGESQAPHQEFPGMVQHPSLQQAMYTVQQGPNFGDADVMTRWGLHLASAYDPKHEADRIVRLCRSLGNMGYNTDGRGAPLHNSAVFSSEGIGAAPAIATGIAGNYMGSSSNDSGGALVSTLPEPATGNNIMLSSTSTGAARGIPGVEQLDQLYGNTYIPFGGAKKLNSIATTRLNGNYPHPWPPESTPERELLQRAASTEAKAGVIEIKFAPAADKKKKGSNKMA